MNFTDVSTSGDVMCPIMPGPSATTTDTKSEENPKNYFQEDSIEWDTHNPHLFPKMPKRHNYGLKKDKREIVENYLINLRDNPPIEYVAEFLCNIFQFNEKTDTHEAYFCDGMGRTFYETILGLFSNKSSSYDKMFELREKFKYRSRNSSGDYACFRGNSVSIEEMRDFIQFFYKYIQENDDIIFNYFTFHYYYRTEEKKQHLVDIINELTKNN